MNMAKLGTKYPSRVALVTFYTQRPSHTGRMQKDAWSTLPSTVCPREATNPPVPVPAGGEEEDERKGAGGALAGGQSSAGGSFALPEGGRELVPRSPGWQGCRWHIKHPAELLAALAQKSSVLPNRNQGGTHAHGVVSPAAALLLARIAAWGSRAARSSPKQPRSGGCKVLPLLLELIPQQDMILRCPPSLSGDPQL